MTSNTTEIKNKEIKLEIGLNLFRSLRDVCDFIALDSDMNEIINAVIKDNKEILKK